MRVSKIIGVFPMFNTGGICVHAIDDAEDKVLASVNGENPEWCEMLNSRRKMEMRWSRAFCSAPFSCRSPGSCACESELGGLT